ncbi:MAG: hypothetical protein EXS31_18580 [Pedosphaera sp.]|nr:hypothetical protein [Pedosphaera sp.]
MSENRRNYEQKCHNENCCIADHVLQRFSARVPNYVGEDLSNFLVAFFGSPSISMTVGPGRAFFVPYHDSLLAFTYEETETEFVITTCLTINEINSLMPDAPPHAFNMHYGRAFTRPKIRHWMPAQYMAKFFKCWERKTALPTLKDKSALKYNWHWIGHWVRDNVRNKGHGPGSQYLFLDNVPGPCQVELLPGQPEPRINELEIYKRTHPEYDWDTHFAELDEKGTADS